MLFEADLKKIGLTDKEAAVYIAALGLGASPVQNIARKAKVARATTYLVLEALIGRGLITRYVEGGKTFFVAESPNQLLHILDKQEEEIHKSKQELRELLPKLQALKKNEKEHAIVKYYEGAEGLNAMRGEIAMNSTAKDVFYNFSPVDALYAEFGSDNFSVDYNRQRLAKGVKVKTIFSTRSEKLKRELLGTLKEQKAQRKFVDPKKMTTTSTMTLYQDKISIANLEGAIGGVIIESPSMAKMMRELFDLAWENLD